MGWERTKSFAKWICTWERIAASSRVPTCSDIFFQFRPYNSKASSNFFCSSFCHPRFVFLFFFGGGAISISSFSFPFSSFSFDELEMSSAHREKSQKKRALCLMGHNLVFFCDSPRLRLHRWQSKWKRRKWTWKWRWIRQVVLEAVVFHPSPGLRTKVRTGHL